MQKVILDTSALMNNLTGIERGFNDYLFLIPTIVLEELDNLNGKENTTKSIKARKAFKFIDLNEEKFQFIISDKTIHDFNPDYETEKNDNKILATCLQEGAMLYTFDRALKIKAASLNIKLLKLNKIEDYKGYIELTSPEDISEFYSKKQNKYGLLINEYLLIKDGKEYKDKYKWDGEKFIYIKRKTIDSKFIGEVEPRNVKQELLFDILFNDDIKIKVAKGTYGTGKDYVMLSHALDSIDKEKYKKLVWARNITTLKDCPEIGYLPGNLDEKLLPFAQQIGDVLGGEEGLNYYLSQNRIELCNLGFIRGRSFKDSIIYCTEAENMTKELMQLLISRVGEGSVLYINGDFKQVDRDVFRENNGFNIMIDRLKGQKEFGFIELDKIERSKVADMSSLLD